MSDEAQEARGIDETEGGVLAPTRRQVVTWVLYAAPLVLTLAARPAFAMSGSGDGDSDSNSDSHKKKKRRR